ncbi:MXAN_6230/SCO0854 family RING domain-containing protein [Nonomuraea typhae]|uniref:MXAN_6230/SCO0854 family RING domain-containing protein n=1 Tax=Nonomuraea typhae TaxID=2603600 RepID=UPI0012FB666F|nr:MXAN_6230/SCO0854 family RING domain-containing protein [Nonomuraea typhae]
MSAVAEILLRTRRLVAVDAMLADGRERPPTGRLRKDVPLVPGDVPGGVAALEGELLQLGFLISAPLRAALAKLGPADLARAGRRLLYSVRTEVGVWSDHVPLFRKFPESVPADTYEFYVRRVFSLLTQRPEQPCVLCGERRTVHPVSPCAHLVCRLCWDGADYSACPICHRRLSPGDPFLRPAPQPGPRARGSLNHPIGVLGWCEDAVAACRELAVSLLERRTPMPAHERDDLRGLLEACWPQSAAWLAETAIPVKETLAVALGVAARHGAVDVLHARLDTATDVLRLLYELTGADPGLRTHPARPALPRPLRRIALACLDRMALPYLMEDLRRHARPWVRMGEVLHPHEHHRRHPVAALAFAALRGTPVDDGTPFGRSMLAVAARHPDAVEVSGGRLRGTTFGSRVERALAEKRYGAAVDVLAARPGELVRRLSQLLRLAPETLPPARLREVVRRVAPGLLLAALGQVRAAPGRWRLFLPRGGTARFWSVLDERTPLADETVLETEQVLAGELLRRASALPPLRRVLLDEGLADLVAPTSERGAAKALVRLTRGTVQPIPESRRLRFFLHWAEQATDVVDLDLSVAVFDERWRFAGLCDYTNLRLGGWLTHSGDLTSAPLPLGSSEFIDVDLREPHGRYLVPIVFSYNDVPFEELVRGFAGFMERPEEGLFDPVAVRQRFDLGGPAKILVPLVADLQTRTIRWADVNLSASGFGHRVAESERELASLGRALQDAFLERVTMWELACWHAAGRAEEVLVRRRDGGLVTYRRRPGEPVAGFAARLIARAEAAPAEAPPGEVALAALVHGDVEVPAEAQVYALYPETAAGRRLEAADLLSGLAP